MKQKRVLKVEVVYVPVDDYEERLHSALDLIAGAIVEQSLQKVRAEMPLERKLLEQSDDLLRELSPVDGPPATAGQVRTRTKSNRPSSKGRINRALALENESGFSAVSSAGPTAPPPGAPVVVHSDGRGAAPLPSKLLEIPASLNCSQQDQTTDNPPSKARPESIQVDTDTVRKLKQISELLSAPAVQDLFKKI